MVGSDLDCRQALMGTNPFVLTLPEHGFKVNYKHALMYCIHIYISYLSREYGYPLTLGIGNASRTLFHFPATAGKSFVHMSMRFSA